jgi:hypothetical protein
MGDTSRLGLIDGESLASFEGNIRIGDQRNATYLDKTVRHGLISSVLKLRDHNGQNFTTVCFINGYSSWIFPVTVGSVTGMRYGCCKVMKSLFNFGRFSGTVAHG